MTKLPPFTLHPLLSPVFGAGATGSANTALGASGAVAVGSPLGTPAQQRGAGPARPSSPPSTPSRLSQLVSNVALVASGEASPASVVGGATTASSSTASAPGTNVANVRSVDASHDRIYVGASDGRVRTYEPNSSDTDILSLIKPSGGMWTPRPASPALTASASASGSSGGRSNPASPSFREIIALDLVDEISVTATRKAADRVAILARLNMAVILSEGILTFHALPSLAPLSVHSFPALRGVTTFALDEDELSGGGEPDSMRLCAIKRRSVNVLRVMRDGLSQVRDLPLRGGAVLCVLRRGHVCLADTENYSIIDLDAAVALPLLPISQAPNLDDPPDVPPGGIDPRQRPAITCVGTHEFLVASHTANTTLGLFVNESGEPCRGTLEWASNVRSLVVDPSYAIALLHNNTVEIHSLRTQEIAQVVHLPTSSSPLGLQPRSLAYSWSGVDLGAASGANKYALVSTPLLPLTTLPSSGPPSTPTRSKGGRTSMPSSPAANDKSRGRGSVTRTFIVGKNSLYALTPLTLAVQADALMDRGRVDDALALADQLEKGSKGGRIQNPELAYVYLRAAFLSLALTHFQDAFKLFLRAGSDPRLVIRLFPDLRSPLMGPSDHLLVCRGVLKEVQEGKSVDEYSEFEEPGAWGQPSADRIVCRPTVMANLEKNYAPHLKPDVETAPPTMELRATLTMTARDCLLSYLQTWRTTRRERSHREGVDDSRKVDITVDTTLGRLYAEEGRRDDLMALLEGKNDCVVQELEKTLLDKGSYDTWATILLQRGETSRALDVWTKILDGIYEDAQYTGGAERIFDLLWESQDKNLLDRFGIPLIKHDRQLGLRLFLDPKQSIQFETRQLLERIQAVDPEAADVYLEAAVLQGKDTDGRLQSDLVTRYIDSLGDLLSDSSILARARDQTTAYTSVEDRASFLSFICSRVDHEAPHADFDRVRLKAILFLSTSKNYDLAAIKTKLESGPRASLVFERAIVYGHLGLHRQALSLLIHSLGDLVSADLYARQNGDLLDGQDVKKTIQILALPTAPSSSSSGTSKRRGTEAEVKRRERDLMRLVVDLCLTSSEQGSTTPIEASRVAALVQAQGMHLDPLSVLERLPSDWPLSLTSTFWARSFRRSLVAQHEAMLLKAIAANENSDVTERVGNLYLSLPPTVQTQGPTAWDRGGDGGEKEKMGGRPRKDEEKVVTEVKVVNEGYRVDEDEVDLS
ncbi:BZ3500_MvSof-1268-A1-R1_Chr2-3g05228 [Microbotryum saponariae]|uniref:BZ3500_MvSof-1268-A1-R1_Chr2-3g05228 protein n=1 Tax=Microbotryum saponariae TaxID=289078 RepID=A0A2X0M0R2_9BASI|nr:BZ3500_MvSof-1268-A1-R1_Chr2-3g05228 [Microbotryum saponariae]SDA01054.1 BZ3501_MvSof-1269-A2-R1_Chr2-2g04901 [Microbotryum saponariae]